ncbi:hypothetical protein M0R04_09005 [Candidatus Dojkabacteria bacterium]|jgi:hypothetical protein|nr:hypothetical protein [Candidatus Dojkabacteria bacterium]
MENSIIIRLAFTYEREIILFEICNKIIIYKDRKWPNGFQFMPRDPKIVKAIILSRNKIRKEMINWINDANSGKNLEEYNNAKDDEDIAKIVTNDCANKGCVFRKKQYVIINNEGKEEEVFLENEKI